MNTIKVYLLDEMSNTPFTFEKGIQYLNKNGIFITQNEKEANWYVTRFFPFKSKTDMLFWRIRHRYIPILVWTDEPRFCTITQNYFKPQIYVPSVHIMNCYTNDIYINPFCIFGYWAISNKLNYATNETIAHKKSKLVCSLGSYRKEPLFINGNNIDLSEYRQNLSIDGYNKGIVDICGPNWPNNIIITQDTRKDKDWHKQKLNFIKDYKFNIAIENTLIKYYISEKIWDPITVGVLPIYYGNQWIYELFKKDSFIDTNNYHNFKDLFEHITTMTDEEYLNRLNLCIETYNKAFDSIDFYQQYYLMIDNIIKKLKTAK
ncbi:MAG: hypothetical protein J6Y24_07415 [Bacteroidales bacterium]|nr:hypothetical protein [Bacteroidales bacterium]